MRRTIYWRNPKKNYAFENIGRIYIEWGDTTVLIDGVLYTKVGE